LTSSGFGRSIGFFKGLEIFEEATGLISETAGNLDIAFKVKMDANSSLTATVVRTAKVSLCFYRARVIGGATLFMSG
jgi:hypothetical protein